MRKHWAVTITAAWMALLLALPCGALANDDLTLSFDAGDHIMLLMSPQTGQVLYAQNEQERVPIASVTKIMTLILTFEAIEAGKIALDDPVTISKTAAATEGSQAFLDAGSAYPVSELIKTIIISSANDSCVAMAEYLAGSEPSFVIAMNERAAQMGLSDTNFCTCTGLPYQGQYSTAAGVAVMAQELLTHDLYFTWSSTWMDTLEHPGGRETELTNTNRLVRFFEGADGVKTGYSSEAGHCLAATATRGEMRLLAVVLGYDNSKTRFTHAQRLLSDGFDQYELVNIAAGGAPVCEIPVQGGSTAQVELIAENALTVLQKKGQGGNYQIMKNLPQQLSAPVRAGTCVGSITVLYPDGTVQSTPVVAAQDVAPDFWGYVAQVARRWCS